MGNIAEQALQALQTEKYAEATSLYEQAIALEPNKHSHYWHLGLALLLQGQESEAQTTWLLAMSQADDSELEIWTSELADILSDAADRQLNLANDPATAWLVRQHLREIQPQNLDNILRLVQLAIRNGRFEPTHLLSISEALRSLDPASLSDLNASSSTTLGALFLETIQQVFDHVPLAPEAIDFLQSSLPFVHDPRHWVDTLMTVANRIGYGLWQGKVASQIVEFCLTIIPDDQPCLGHLATFYQKAGQYDRCIETAEKFSAVSSTLPFKIYGNFLKLRGMMMAGGMWKEAQQTAQVHQQLLQQIIEAQPRDLDQNGISCLYNSTFFFPYLIDDLATNRYFHNQISRLCQANVENLYHPLIERYRQGFAERPNDKVQRPLKIGYLSYCLKQHSVGWLARWVYQHHDPNVVQVHTYLVNHRDADPFTDYWFTPKSYKTHNFIVDSTEIAEQIFQDEIDILVDLDSLTLDITCDVMALKPAPVQVTWLGWDASGLPTIDYYLADPYCLPENAQAHYQEKIWRLPTTYIAVDGFEVGVPDLRREDLDIPVDAVVYLSAQRGQKRNPETARWQVQIIQQVPNSYLLIKGLAKEDALKQSFYQLADELGVDRSRLRFLPDAISELVHRANAMIADIVLDTYPYNGATTTLETLWMGIPMVTRAGQHFSSRNSYTMMINAGITEGVAWSAEEYIDWGVRLGCDRALRDQVANQLRASRRSSPLWNGRQFTCDLEAAYHQMWQIYCNR